MRIDNARGGVGRPVIARRTLLVGLAAAAASPRGLAADAPAVAVAASLRPTMDEIAGLFAQATGHSLRLSYGASGNFVRQIAQGAPFELLLAADEASAAALATIGRSLGPGRVYARGRLALVAPRASKIRLDDRLDGIRAALAAGRINKFAIANPDIAPYGRAALQALEAQALLKALEPRLVRAENVAQAAQFVASGAAEAGLTAYSLTRAGPLGEALTTMLILDHWHAPINQAMVLATGAGAVARAFHDFMLAAAARAVLERHGFTVP